MCVDHLFMFIFKFYYSLVKEEKERTLRPKKFTNCGYQLCCKNQRKKETNANKTKNREETKVKKMQPLRESS